MELPYLYLTATNNKEFTGNSSLTSFCAKSREEKNKAEAPYFTNQKVSWKRRSLRIISRFLKEELPSNQHELIIWKMNLFVTSVTCSRYEIAFKWSVNFWLQLLSIRWNGKYFNGWNFYLEILQIQRKFKKTELAEIW